MSLRPRVVLDRWLDCVNARDLDGTLALYDEAPVLLPTFSNRSLTSLTAIRGYFQTLFAHQEVRVTLHEKTLRVQEFSDALCALSGIYLWQFDVDSEVLSFEARFTLVCDLNSPRPIRHHHSSQIPRSL